MHHINEIFPVLLNFIKQSEFIDCCSEKTSNLKTPGWALVRNDWHPAELATLESTK